MENLITAEKLADLSGKVAVVTGANRGLGFEVTRQLTKLGAKVILTCRNLEAGQKAQLQLQQDGYSVDLRELDVLRDDSPRALSEYVLKNYGRLDILINNAGVLPDNQLPGQFSDTSILETGDQEINLAFDTNALGVVRVCRHLVPIMKKHNSGRIVNVSSLVAQLSSMESGSPAYRLSKVALNAVTRILADELEPYNIQVNSVSPGWVKTEMGGPNASISVEEGALTITRLACATDDARTGRFIRNGAEIEW